MRQPKDVEESEQIVRRGRRRVGGGRQPPRGATAAAQVDKEEPDPLQADQRLSQASVVPVRPTMDDKQRPFERVAARGDVQLDDGFVADPNDPLNQRPGSLA